MRSFLQFNPVTRKRLRRFRRLRRAYASAWLLAGIVLLTLAADLLCNDNPLYIRFNGRHLFPVFRFYPESAFIPGGNATRPDYKTLRQHPVFRADRSNIMILAPVPYGPRETIDERTIRAEHDAHIVLLPIPRAGSVNIARNMRIERELASGFFFGRDGEDVTGLRLDTVWPLSGELREALVQRFDNRECPLFRQAIDAPALPGVPIEITMPAYTPRPESPTTVRLTLRTLDGPESRRASITLGRHDSNPDASSLPLWETLDPAARVRLRELAATARLNPVEPVEVSAGHHRYQAVFDTAVSWPHPPVRGHWLGIDSAGRDVLSRLVHGLRVSLVFSVLLVFSSMTLGVVIGALQGYYGGITDMLTQRAIEIWSAIPFLYVMILLGSVYGASLWLLLFCYAIFNWIGISYYLRAEFLRLRKAPFVDAARALGAGDATIIFRHILPNAITPVITFAPFSLVGAVAALAALDYLGFGLPALTPSIGQLLHQAQTHRSAWWLILYPSLTLFVVMLLGVFVGEGIREAYDPRPRSRLE
jgi:microcin C transport system permease protein